MLENHPLLIEKESYKVKYLNVLEYFSQKYSANDPWANQTLQLYIKKVLGTKNSHKYDNFDVVATMSAGKSTLINALLRQKLMPAKQEACTATITEIMFQNFPTWKSSH